MQSNAAGCSEVFAGNVSTTGLKNINDNKQKARFKKTECLKHLMPFTDARLFNVDFYRFINYALIPTLKLDSLWCGFTAVSGGSCRGLFISSNNKCIALAFFAFFQHKLRFGALINLF